MALLIKRDGDLTTVAMRSDWIVSGTLSHTSILPASLHRSGQDSINCSSGGCDSTRVFGLLSNRNIQILGSQCLLQDFQAGVATITFRGYVAVAVAFDIFFVVNNDGLSENLLKIFCIIVVFSSPFNKLSKRYWFNDRARILPRDYLE